ncbi:MAG: 4-hydroxy-tetrahydrodipicolinate reductase [Xanthomonadaceae bacterium]|nr:4-hydroxy-tetrahydrodipicolinate reductase [Xanthomonadaceae bacterium]
MDILLSGASGKVGREIERLVGSGRKDRIAGRADRNCFFDSDRHADVLIDFSRPALCARSLEFACSQKIPLVIGTTGLDDEMQLEIDAAAAGIAICQAANFSIGVNLLMKLVGDAAGALDESEFDIEISEIHHRWKVDAPSGTALALGRAAAQARGQRHRDVAAFDRHAAEAERAEGQIGYQTVRGGDVAGEHTVYFLGDGERLELSHRATDRAIFARGALVAARWLLGRPAGLYGMGEVLGMGEVPSGKL